MKATITHDSRTIRAIEAKIKAPIDGLIPVKIGEGLTDGVGLKDIEKPSKL
jgi:hypothetical protein